MKFLDIVLQLILLFVYLCVCVCSSLSGELVMWDLTRTGKQMWTLFGTSSEGQNHSRIIFNMSSIQLQDDRELLISTSMDREVGQPSFYVTSCSLFIGQSFGNVLCYFGSPYLINYQNSW